MATTDGGWRLLSERWPPEDTLVWLGCSDAIALGKWEWCPSGAAGAFPFDAARNVFMRWVYEPGFKGARWTHWYPHLPERPSTVVRLDVPSRRGLR